MHHVAWTRDRRKLLPSPVLARENETVLCLGRAQFVSASNRVHWREREPLPDVNDSEAGCRELRTLVES